MTRRDPLWGVLRDQGRYNLVWLARTTGYSHSHVKAMAAGSQPASPRFRAACARVLGMREQDLFHSGDSSSRPDGDAGSRADTSDVSRLYHAGRALSSTG
jgi:hypothetical protein